MFLFFHALALALGLLGAFGSGFSHVGGGPMGAMLQQPPVDGGGSMPGPGGGGGLLGSGQSGG
jgi:hypothetical protein